MPAPSGGAGSSLSKIEEAATLPLELDVAQRLAVCPVDATDSLHEGCRLRTPLGLAEPEASRSAREEEEAVCGEEEA